MNEELREAIAQAVGEWDYLMNPADAYLRLADTILALPEMAALLADSERVRRAMRNAVTWLETGFPERAEAALRHALDGDPS